jgi:hypothetical protein
VGSVWGHVIPLFGASNGVTKKVETNELHLTLGGRWSMMQHSTHNQKHMGAMEQYKRAGATRRGARRGDDTIILGGIRS